MIPLEVPSRGRAMYLQSIAFGKTANTDHRIGRRHSSYAGLKSPGLCWPCAFPSLAEGPPLARSLAPALSRVPRPGKLGGCELGLLAIIGSSSLAIKDQGIKGLKGPIWRGGSR